jgi:hypothetical protein
VKEVYFEQYLLLLRAILQHPLANKVACKWLMDQSYLFSHQSSFRNRVFEICDQHSNLLCIGSQFHKIFMVAHFFTIYEHGESLYRLLCSQPSSNAQMLISRILETYRPRELSTHLLKHLLPFLKSQVNLFGLSTFSLECLIVHLEYHRLSTMVVHVFDHLRVRRSKIPIAIAERVMRSLGQLCEQNKSILLEMVRWYYEVCYCSFFNYFKQFVWWHAEF